MLRLLALLLLFASTLNAAIWLGDWLEKNEPIVKSYLEELRDYPKDASVEGVALSDGTVALAGLQFVGYKYIEPSDLHVYILKE